ncbi:hypothetical protein CCUG63695_02899 [Mycobacteroides franklinii]|uniref:Uncharacterized protein n=1 Tax=Mycobacteroides franklinii TaxID=948102 RepID=A0A4R8R1P3_9MYCO|nr:hypothetical protein CCUG64054_02972 [Mycobacteroides franklinii]TDZ50055.1 hypothetical protein CCUG63697_01557 [Mycobacteroides franklinii]TDZ56476.1 hypothetical protein CCUG63696_02974 [Mycobacteroides franklinii]TDZ63417.1 hypothetical protein CCUG63695_02899 [Mycobacteroides franklinii]TDZ69814.1 hypothetical protein CCUG64056_02972 [Mycobacteroides franklinii]
MPSKPCCPMLTPRRRARSTSQNSPSGFNRAIIRSAPVRNCSGRNWEAMTASCCSAASRVGASTTTGNRSKNCRMIRTCSSPISPRPNASAVRGSTGANLSPVIARRGANCCASAIRRRAAPLPICNRRDNTSANDVPPSSTGDASPVTMGTKPTPRADNRRCTTSRRANTVNASAAVSPSTESAQKTSTARQSALHNLQARQHRQRLSGREPIDRISAEDINRRLQHPDRTHVRIIETPTDKPAAFVTNEVIGTEVISHSRRIRAIALAPASTHQRWSRPTCKPPAKISAAIQSS